MTDRKINMEDAVRFQYTINGDDFTSAGKASVNVKKMLRQLGLDADTIRRVSVAMYEGEINMVIHAEGGLAEVLVCDDIIRVILADKGPGIPDVSMAMQEGFSTAKDNISSTAPDNIRSLGFGAGMGLPNMRRYSDDMKIDTVVGEGTTVTMDFDIPNK